MISVIGSFIHFFFTKNLNIFDIVLKEIISLEIIIIGLFGKGKKIKGIRVMLKQC